MISLREPSVSARLGEAYYDACVQELNALKPGNVHRYAPGHGMTLDDFVKSAEASKGPVSDLGLGLGERIYRGVAATREVVGCNTNLGILLMCAPLIQAVLAIGVRGSLRQRLLQSFHLTGSTDTSWLFKAISLAEPGGLGESPRYDVRGSSHAPLMEVMSYAYRWDRIAALYVSGYADLFDYAKPLFVGLQNKWGDANGWAVSALYLRLLHRHPDTHISRKHGVDRAHGVSAVVADLADRLAASDDPEQYQEPLLELDHEFKKEGINPGTTADITVAVLLLIRLEKILSEFEPKTGFPRTPGYRQRSAGGPNIDRQ